MKAIEGEEEGDWTKEVTLDLLLNSFKIDEAW